ncbi:cytochrome P450 [Aspergillus carlsbadensis]|nr:cytochrome P450 [Aspergillus carlsbadensis]
MAMVSTPDSVFSLCREYGERLEYFDLLCICVGASIFYGISLATYRLYLSPLADIPGSMLAALTFWYEIYYDIWLGGQYFREIARMHETYGPIVRINPSEVHFNDPEVVDTIYPGYWRRTEKPKIIGWKTGTQYSIVGTIDHGLHRKRRNAINSFFSSASIRRLEPIMQANIQKLLARLDQVGKSNEVLQLHHAIKACTCDIITEYAFGESFGFIDQEDYATPYMKATDYFHFFSHTMGYFPVVGVMLALAPTWFIEQFIPPLAELWRKRSMWQEKFQKIRASPNPDRIKSTIFEGLINSSLPDSEKSDARLAHEAQLIVFAGQGTVAYSITAAIFELLANPADFEKVRDELCLAIPDADADTIPRYSQVECLPYFQAALQEALRLHPAVCTRLPRVSPDTPIVYTRTPPGNSKGDSTTLEKTYTIPRGTTTSMSPSILHMNPDIFPGPAAYRPQRWIDDPRLDRAIIVFAKGTRNCIGMNLARQQMSVMVAAIIRKYDLYRGQAGPALELYDTMRERDIDLARDMIIPFPVAGSQGLRVRIRN